MRADEAVAGDGVIYKVKPIRSHLTADTASGPAGKDDGGRVTAIHLLSLETRLPLEAGGLQRRARPESPSTLRPLETPSEPCAVPPPGAEPPLAYSWCDYAALQSGSPGLPSATTGQLPTFFNNQPEATRCSICEFFFHIWCIVISP